MRSSRDVRAARRARWGEGAVAVALCLAAAGCADGLAGSPSVTDSPAAAADLSASKARGELQRESLGAHCWADAVVAGAVERRALRDGAAVARGDVRVLTVEQARRWLVAGDSAVVPVYCRSAEASAVASAQPSAAKFQDAARWYPARALVLSNAAVPARVSARGSAAYREFEARDTGYRSDVYYDRSGARTLDTSAPLHGGRRESVPVMETIVHRRGETAAAEAAGAYWEAWLLVEVPRAKAAAYRADCERRRIEPGRAPAGVVYEAAVACALYAGGALPRGVERPAVVPLNPEE